MIQQSNVDAPLLSEIIFSFYRLSPLFSTLITASFFMMLYFFILRIYKPESIKIKLVSIVFNQLTFSSILFCSSLTGYIIRSSGKLRFAVMSFIFVFIFLTIVALLYKSTDRK